MKPAQRPTKRGPSSLRAFLLSFAGIAWLIAGLLAIVVTVVVCTLNLPKPWAVAVLAALAASLLVPLSVPAPAFARRFLRFSVEQLRDYFPIHVVYEDKDAVSGPGPFMIGYEPHSVLPLGMCVFSPTAAGMPPGLTNTHVAVTSSLFIAPIIRHLVWWWPMRPASREQLWRSLTSGTTVAVCPGGVQECFYMDPEEDGEVVFLKRRTGFVRLAMQAGAPILPVFAFGQTPHYRYWRPFIDWPRRLVPRGAMGSFVRRIGYVPMLVWGWLGTALPHKMPLHVVVGRPIEVPKVADPSPEQVQQYLQQYIAAIEGLFEQHKAAVGHARATLTVY